MPEIFRLRSTFLTARNEFYVGYGDPNSLSTYPSAYIKWIRYIGAEKGS